VGRVAVKTYAMGAVIVVAFATAQHAFAADDIMVTKAAPGPSNNFAYNYNWTGFYAGAHLGEAWGSSNWTASAPGAPAVSGALNLYQPLNVFNDTASFFEGLQAGYNYMLPNRVVLGAEADVSFPSFPNSVGISIGGTSAFTSPTLGAVSYSETVLSSGTVRGRIGYAPGSWLFYATSGFAWTYNQQSLTQISTGATDSPFLWRLGFAVGGGMELGWKGEALPRDRTGGTPFASQPAPKARAGDGRKETGRRPFP